MLTVLTSSTSDALTTVAAVKSHLGIVGSSEDVRLGELIDRASAAIGRYCGRTFARQRYLETVPGYGGALLEVGQRPIRTVSIVTLRGEAITDFSVEDPDAGWLYRERGWEWTKTVNWSLSDRIVSGGELPVFSVTYEAGYLYAASASSEGRTLPPDLEEAAIETVAAWRTASRRDPAVASRSLGPLSVQYSGVSLVASNRPDGAMPANARALCQPHRASALG